MRDTREEIMEDLLEEIKKRIQKVCLQNHLKYSIEQKSWLKPVSCDPHVQAVIEDAIKDLNYDQIADEIEETSALGKGKISLGTKLPSDVIKRQGYITMPSGAGHDTQNMALLAPSGMIFVPSREGISHAPEEFTEWQDIEKGANVLLHSIVKLLEE